MIGGGEHPLEARLCYEVCPGQRWQCTGEDQHRRRTFHAKVTKVGSARASPRTAVSSKLPLPLKLPTREVRHPGGEHPEEYKGKQREKVPPEPGVITPLARRPILDACSAQSPSATLGRAVRGADTSALCPPGSGAQATGSGESAGWPAPPPAARRSRGWLSRASRSRPARLPRSLQADARPRGLPNAHPDASAPCLARRARPGCPGAALPGATHRYRHLPPPWRR